jgi:hypothetical protein
MQRWRFYNWLIKNYSEFNWHSKIKFLLDLVEGLAALILFIKKQMVHHDFHIGYILAKITDLESEIEFTYFRYRVM